MFILALFLTAFVYLIFPIIYVFNHGKVSPKKGKKLALSNVIICATIFLIGTAIIASASKNSNAEFSGYSLAPAFFYYFIAKAILTDKTLTDDDKSTPKKDDDTKNDDETNYFYNETYDEENIRDNYDVAEQVSSADEKSLELPDSLQQLPPDVLALLAYSTRIAINDDAPAEDYVKKVRQKTVKDAQPEIDELYFNTFKDMKGKDISNHIVDKFTETYADILIKHYKRNILKYLQKNESWFQSMSLEECDAMLDIVLSVLKDQISESKPIIAQQLKNYKKLLDDIYNA